LNGPAYWRAGSESEVLEGGWFEGDPSACPTDAEFLFGIGTVEPDGLPQPKRGYLYSEKSESSNLPTLPEPWQYVRSLDETDSETRPALYTPGDGSWLQEYDRIKDRSNLVCDARQLTPETLKTFHTLPVNGWLQAPEQESIKPPPYQSYADPRGTSGREPVFLFVHGYTGSPGNWDYLADELKGNGYFAPLLPGHGLPAEGFAQFGAYDWLESVDYWSRRLEEDHASTIGVGLSMGGALVVTNWEKYDALVLINTPLRIPDWRRFFLPLLEWMKTYHEFEDSEKVIPVRSLRDLEMTLEWGRDTLPEVQVPTLVINHKGDRTVSPNHGRVLANKLPDAEHRILEEGIHESPTEPKVAKKLHEEITQWLKQRNLMGESSEQ
jgi:esterase/lipase